MRIPVPSSPVLPDHPDISAHAFADHIVTSYQIAYSGGNQGHFSTTQAWVHLDRIDKLMEALNRFAVLATGKYTAELFDIQFRVQKFYFPDNKDLAHFMQLIQARIPDHDIQNAAAEVEQAAHDFVGLSLTTKGQGMFDPDYHNAFGTAVYFTSRGQSFKASYLDLDFAKNSQWVDFMRTYHRLLEERLR